MIRVATFDDLPALVELSRLYHREAHAWLPFDPDYVREQFRLRTIDTVDGMCWLIEDGGEMQGYLAAVVTNFFAAPVKVAVELAWFVKPGARGRGDLLIDDFEAWAKWKVCVGCSLSMNEFPDPKRTAALARLYARRGYKPYERGCLKMF